MSNKREKIVSGARSIGVETAKNGRPVILFEVLKGKEVGIALEGDQSLELIWRLLKREMTNEAADAPKLNQLARGQIKLPEAIAPSEISTGVSHDLSHIFIALRFGKITLPIRLVLSVIPQLRQMLVEVETAMQWDGKKSH